jgi:hypothetical protein
VAAQDVMMCPEMTATRDAVFVAITLYLPEPQSGYFSLHVMVWRGSRDPAAAVFIRGAARYDLLCRKQKLR